MRPKEAKRGSKKGANNKSSVRSKVSEVRKGGKKVSKAVVAKMTMSAGGEEEIRDLVTPTATPNKAKKKGGGMVRSLSGKLQKAKSAVGLNGRHSRLQETPSSKSGKSPAKVKRLQSSQKLKESPSVAPDRRSTRRARALPASNGVDTTDNGGMDVDVSLAKEATEYNIKNVANSNGNASSNPSLLQRISAPFRRGSYEALENGNSSDKGSNNANSNSSNCVIS